MANDCCFDTPYVIGCFGAYQKDCFGSISCPTPETPDVETECCGAVPQSLVATFSMSPVECPCLDGEKLAFTWQSGSIWESDELDVESLCGGPAGDRVVFQLECTEANEWHLTLIRDDCNFPIDENATSEVCDPFELKFSWPNPIGCSPNCDSDGTEEIVITPA